MAEFEAKISGIIDRLVAKDPFFQLLPAEETDPTGRSTYRQALQDGVAAAWNEPSGAELHVPLLTFLDKLKKAQEDSVETDPYRQLGSMLESTANELIQCYFRRKTANHTALRNQGIQIPLRRQLKQSLPLQVWQGIQFMEQALLNPQARYEELKGSSRSTGLTGERAGLGTRRTHQGSTSIRKNGRRDNAGLTR